MEDQAYIDHIKRLREIYHKDGEIKPITRLDNGHNVAKTLRNKTYNSKKKCKQKLTIF